MIGLSEAQQRVLDALSAWGCMDAYKASRACPGISAMDAGRAMAGLEAEGLVARMEEGGSNALATVFRACGVVVTSAVEGTCG